MLSLKRSQRNWQNEENKINDESQQVLIVYLGISESICTIHPIHMLLAGCWRFVGTMCRKSISINPCAGRLVNLENSGD